MSDKRKQKMEVLSEKKCQVCEIGSGKAMSIDAAMPYLSQLNEWQISEDGKKITKRFSFKGFYKTMAFVNAVAWVANTEGHHPDMQVGYNYCVIDFTTHAADGLTENDFICAAKVDKLM